MTTVERQVPIQNGVGTAVVDARLTTLAPPTTIGVDGGRLTAPSIAVAITAGSLPAPAAMSLTRLSAQGLPALLPLGWSPLTAFLVSGDAAALAMTATVDGLPALGTPPANPTLVTYKSPTHGWFVVTPQIEITASSASFTISGAGALSRT